MVVGCMVTAPVFAVGHEATGAPGRQQLATAAVAVRLPRTRVAYRDRRIAPGALMSRCRREHRPQDVKSQAHWQTDVLASLVTEPASPGTRMSAPCRSRWSCCREGSPSACACGS